MDLVSFGSNSQYMSDKKNIRIKDIAQMAGVSVGTVDRVLHGRGRVSPDAAKKVEEVLAQTGYKPNLIARTLGSNKTLRVAVLLPDPNQDEYWNLAQSGIEQSLDDWSYYDVEIECFYFDLYDAKSFEQTVHSTLSFEPDGVVLAPVFYQESTLLLESLSTSKIPFVLFNSNIPASNPLCFIGQNLHQSGRVAAELISLGTTTSTNILVLHMYENLESSVYLKNKENGLRDFFKDSDYTIVSHDLTNPREIEAKVIEAITGNTRGIFVSTSTGTHIVASILEKRGLSDLCLVGFDLLDENLKYLKKGTINFLINQNPKRMAKIGVNHLVNHLLFKKELPTEETFPIEVITRENMNSYLESTIH
ncbi:MAG: LacI family DNA-binding transcriptional regulator [Marinoscillum sp.]